MLFMNFYSRIRKLNPRIWIDVNRESRQRDSEYPTAGMYLGDRFLMGVPHIEVPEFSVSALDFNKMTIDGRFEELDEALETGFHPEEKILWRGWRAIVSSLIRQGYVDKTKAERLFDTHFNTQQKEFPRNFINRQL